MYQPRKQAKEAYVTIAAQQRHANQPVKLSAAAKMDALAGPVHPEVPTQGGRSPVAGETTPIQPHKADSGAVRHPLADPIRRNSRNQNKEGQAYESMET